MFSKKRSANIEHAHAQTLQKANDQTANDQTANDQTANDQTACKYERQEQISFCPTSYVPYVGNVVDNQQVHHLYPTQSIQQSHYQQPVYVYPVQTCQVYPVSYYDQSLYQSQQPSYFPQQMPYVYQVPTQETFVTQTQVQQVNSQTQTSPIQSVEDPSTKPLTHPSVPQQSTQPIQYQDQHFVKQFVDTVKLQLLLQQISRDVLIQVINQMDHNTLAQLLPQVFPQVLNEVLPQVLPQIVNNTYITEQSM